VKDYNIPEEMFLNLDETGLPIQKLSLYLIHRKGKPKVNNEYLEKVKTESMLFCLPCLCGKVG
jgi:hypothetical protein